MPTVTRIKRPWLPDKPAPAPHQGRTQTNRDIYNSSRWVKLRKLFLNENPMCVHCKAKRISKGAVDVDHIVPINQGADPWDESNWQSLCKSCHARKSAKERHQSKQQQP